MSVSDVSSVFVPAFLPSRSGLQFVNAFPHEGLVTISIPGVATLALGDAANGLCGGMASTVRDLFESSVPPPADTTPPGQGTPRYQYLVQRQIDTLDPVVAARLYELGSPAMPEAASQLGPFGGIATAIGQLGAGATSRSQTIAEEWALIKADLDGGRTCLIAMVRTIDADPASLGHDHQVLAHGYELDGSALSIAVYDPNHPGDDSIRLSLSLADPSQPIAVSYSANDGPVYCFIRMPYAHVDPAPWR